MHFFSNHSYLPFTFAAGASRDRLRIPLVPLVPALVSTQKNMRKLPICLLNEGRGASCAYQSPHHVYSTTSLFMLILRNFKHSPRPAWLASYLAVSPAHSRYISCRVLCHCVRFARFALDNESETATFNENISALKIPEFVPFVIHHQVKLITCSAAHSVPSSRCQLTCKRHHGGVLLACAVLLQTCLQCQVTVFFAQGCTKAILCKFREFFFSASCIHTLLLVFTLMLFFSFHV